jgi:hypothetical protein
MSEHPLWNEFVAWAEENHVDVHGHVEDYISWWECFLAGSIAGVRAVVTSQLAPIEHEAKALLKKVEKSKRRSSK